MPPKSFLPQDIQPISQRIGEHFITESQSLNSELAQEEKSLLVKRLEKRSKTLLFLQNELVLISNPSDEEKKMVLENIQNRFIPNPGVKKVDLLEPISNEEIQISK
jgi:hypothetical protein